MLTCIHESFAINTMPELKRNVLNFGYGVNFKYDGMLSHSFDRFYVVTKFELPKVEDLKLTTMSYDSTCQYLEKAKSIQSYPTQYIRDMKNDCIKIAPYVDYYKKQIDYYNQTAYEIITNELALILPTFPKQERQKRGIITSLVTGFISLAYEGISSFLHYKRQKALHKAVQAMENKEDLQCNSLSFGRFSGHVWYI